MSPENRLFKLPMHMCTVRKNTCMYVSNVVLYEQHTNLHIPTLHVFKTIKWAFY